MQTVSSHYMLSLLHILKMLMNATATLQPTVEYLTLFFSMFFSIPLLLLFFSTIPLPPLAFVYVHFSTFPFSLAIRCSFSITLSTFILL
jgi:hypothetical protein